MKRFLFLVVIIVSAGFTACEDTNAAGGSEAITCKIFFDANGGSGGQTAPLTAVFGEPMPDFGATVPVKEGASFTGYFDAQTGGTKYYNADLSSAKSWDKREDTTLYAQWEIVPPGTSAITFNANGGSGGQTAPLMAVFDEPMPALSAQAPENEDSSDGYIKYYFDGYWDAQTGGKKYYNADLSSASNWDKAGDTGLFARWLTAAQKYNITLGQDDITAYFIETPPEIDGDGSDPAWAKARWQDIKYAWMYTSPKSLSGTLNADGTV